MYPLDRRFQASFVYSLFSSLRKTAVVLQVSHTTVSRWLKHPERKVYTRTIVTKASQLTESIKLHLQNNPFLSLQQLKDYVFSVFKVKIYKELIRAILKKQRLSKKKAKYFGSPAHLPAKTQEFLTARDAYIRQGCSFVSLDETSFGRNGIETRGYSPVGQKLIVKKVKPRMTTVSAVAVVSSQRIEHWEKLEGSYNKERLIGFLTNLNLSNNTVFLIDNVSFHHSKEVVAFAATKGWKFLYTPPYSPWFNPIEGVFSIIKRHYYQYQSIEESFASVSSSHCKAFFDKSMRIKDMPKN
jgi:transposase